MAITIKELITNREKIEQKKQNLFDLKTSIGTVTIKPPTLPLMLEITDLEKDISDKYLILQSVVEPDLKNKELQKAYGCMEPIDIVEKLFQPGEIFSISKKIMSCSGFGAEIEAKIHEKVKN